MEAFKSKKDNKYRYLYKITNNLTGQYYYVFDNEDGSKLYSFIKNNSIIVAYRAIKEYYKN